MKLAISNMKAELERLLEAGELPAGPTSDWVRFKLAEIQAGDDPIGGVLRIVYDDHSEELDEENAARLRWAVAAGEDMYEELDVWTSDANPDFTVYLDGIEVHNTY